MCVRQILGITETKCGHLLESFSSEKKNRVSRNLIKSELQSHIIKINPYILRLYLIRDSTHEHAL